MASLELTAHKHIPLLCFQIPLTDNRLSLGCAHRTALGLGSASRLLPHLLGLFLSSAHRPSPDPVTLRPAHVPGSSLRPPLGPGLRSPPRPALLARPQVPPRCWVVAREAYGLQVWSFASGRPEGRRFGPSVPTILEFLYWFPRARPLEAARPARARRICRDESAGVAPAASRECGTDGGGAPGLAG